MRGRQAQPLSISPGITTPVTRAIPGVTASAARTTVTSVPAAQQTHRARRWAAGRLRTVRQQRRLATPITRYGRYSPHDSGSRTAHIERWGMRRLGAAYFSDNDKIRPHGQGHLRLFVPLQFECQIPCQPSDKQPVTRHYEECIMPVMGGLSEGRQSIRGGTCHGSSLLLAFRSVVGCAWHVGIRALP